MVCCVVLLLVCCVFVLCLYLSLQDYTHFHLDTNLTKVDVTANITTFNLALLGVLANLHGTVSPGLAPFADVLMQAISTYVGVCSCLCMHVWM